MATSRWANGFAAESTGQVPGHSNGLPNTNAGTEPDNATLRRTLMVIASVLIGLAILAGMGGLLTTEKWLLIIAGLLLVAGLVVSAVFGRGKTRNPR
jgi:hypothetical protein